MDFRIRRRRQGARRLPFLLLGALALGAAGLAVWLLEAPGEGPVPPRPVAGATPVRQPAPSAPAPTPSVPVVPYDLRPPFAIYDAVTFGTEGGTPTRLGAVSGPDAEAVCRDGDGRLWACGLAARAGLNNLLRGHDVRCTTSRPDNVPLRASCIVDGRDLATELVRAGFARPDRDGGPLDRAARDAREAGRGLWAGGWAIRP